MKIYTLTCHDLYNFGATLQAYALMKYLEEDGHEVEIIDYRPDYHSKALARFDVFWAPEKWERTFVHKIIYMLVKAPFRYLKIAGTCKSSFQRFNKKYLKLTPTQYTSLDELKSELPLADVYIVGSDQVWNTNQSTGRDPVFYLDFAPDEFCRVSYAASLATSEINPRFKAFVKNMVASIHHVSVREESGVNILNDLGIAGVFHVIDPVFLKDRDFWDGMSNMEVSRGYILVYAFENDDKVKSFVKELAKKRNLKIYSVENYNKTPYADVDYYNAGPEGFLSLIKHADIVVGNSLHALAFSLIFEKEFYVFRRKGKDINARMCDLLALVGMEKRMDPTISLIQSVSLENDRVPYQTVRKILKREIIKSKKFLDNAILTLRK